MIEARACVNCGKVVRADRERYCNHCGEVFYVDTDPLGLVAASNGWTTPVLVRVYDRDDKGSELMSREARDLGEHGYQPMTQSEDSGHVHAGRLILTGGLSIFAGKAGIRSDGRVTVSYGLKSAQASSLGDPIDQIRRLGELRDAGIVSSEEFEAKKAELLSRM